MYVLILGGVGSSGPLRRGGVGRSGPLGRGGVCKSGDFLFFLVSGLM